MSLTVHQLLKSAPGTVRGASALSQADLSAQIACVVTDSRQVRPGYVFCSLPSEQQSDLASIGEAFRRGAIGVVGSYSDIQPPEGCWMVETDAPHRVIEQSIRACRSNFTGRVVAVCGRGDNAMIREMVHAVLNTRMVGTLATTHAGELSGIPLGLLKASERDDYIVLDFAAHQGDSLAEALLNCQPHVACMVDFDSVGGVSALDAPRAWLAALPIDSLAVINIDNPWLRRSGMRSAAKIAGIGRSSDADYSATDVRYANGELRFTVGDHAFRLNVWGRHHLPSALTAIAVGDRLGISWSDMIDALAAFEPLSDDCRVERIGGVTLIDDAQSDIATASRASLELLRDIESRGRRIVVCGDLHDIGSESGRAARQLGQEVVTHCGADLLVTCGRQGVEVVSAACEAGMPAEFTLTCLTPEDAARHVARLLQDDDCVLVKGSPATRMDHCTQSLREILNETSIAHRWAA